MRHKPSPLAILLVPVVVGLVLTLFAWPSARLEPRDLPVGVVGAAPPVPDDSFEVHRYDDEAAAREAIRDREVYGAWVATPGGMKVLTSSAASSLVAQLLTQAAQESRVEAVEGIKIDKTRDSVIITLPVSKELIEKAAKMGGGS